MPGITFPTLGCFGSAGTRSTQDAGGGYGRAQGAVAMLIFLLTLSGLPWELWGPLSLGEMQGGRASA